MSSIIRSDFDSYFNRLKVKQNGRVPSQTFPVVYSIHNQPHSKVFGKIVKSPNDRCEYRPLTLDNGIRVLLVSDKKSDTADTEKDKKLSAAGLCINVGSFSDPPDLPGLAHFLEHMVFMGSSKYPDENDFESFVSKHGGHTNAYTELERTSFYFDIHHNHFQEALDKFAHFFSDSLLKEDAVDREIEAIDGEFCMNGLRESYRIEQIYASLAKLDNPMNKFTWGNRISLKTIPEEKGIDVHARLREFYHRLYSSKYMTLAVQSKDSLDDLETWVRTSFSSVKDNGLPQPTFHHLTDPFDTPEFYKFYKVISLTKTFRIDLTWCLPPTDQLYHVKPLYYIESLIAHESKGSLLAYLKSKCWALSLSAGNSGQGNEFNSFMSAFVISVKLTETGYENLEQVLDAVFSYIKLLRRCGPKEHIYKEIQTIADNDFRFLEQTEPDTYVTELCENMQLYPVHEYLTGNYLMIYKPEVLKQFTEMLTPEKVSLCAVTAFSSENDLAKTEPWFGTEYKQTEINPDWVKRWSSIEPLEQFHLPAPNEFIATDFSLRDIDSSLSTDIPTPVFEDQFTKVHVRQENKFRIPRAHYYFHLITPSVNESARAITLLDLYIDSLLFNLSEVAYGAEEAGLNYEIDSYDTGMTIVLWGFHHKLTKLFEVVIEHAINLTCGEELFKHMQQRLKKRYHRSLFNPKIVAEDALLQICKQRYWWPLSTYAVVDDLTKDDLMTFVKDLYSKLYVESYISGNVTREEALSLNQTLKEKIKFKSLSENLIQKPLHQELMPKPRVFQLPEGTTVCRIETPLANDTCVVKNYYQVGPGRSVAAMCINEMLHMVMKEPCYDILRTKLQLGYSVFTTSHIYEDIFGFSVTVCSKQSKFSAGILDKHMEDFIQEFSEMLSNMSDDEFKVQVEALINVKRCGDNNLSEKVDRDWREIRKRTYVFNKLDLQIEELKKLSRVQVLDHFKQYSSLADSGRFAKLSVQVEGRTDGTDSYSSVHSDTENEEVDETESESTASEIELESGQWGVEGDKYELKFMKVEGMQCITNIEHFQKNLELYD